MTERNETDIINMSLDILGKASIADIASARAGELVDAIKRRYQGAFNIALQMAEWPEIRTVRILPTAVTPPDDEFLNAVQAPSDLLKIWTINGSKRAFKRRRSGSQGEGLILTNAPVPITVIYGRRVPPAEMSEVLARLCAAQLAVDVKSHAALKTSKSQEVDGILRIAVRDANFITGSDDGTEVTLTSPWLSAMDGL